MVSEQEVPSCEGTDAPAGEGTKYRSPTTTSETTQPLSIRKKRGFAAALWARTPIENIDFDKAPVSLTPTSDPRPNDHRVFSPKRSCWTEKDWPTIIGQGELSTNRNGTPYTPGQQAVLRDTMDMLRTYSDGPSIGEFGAMDPGEQRQVVKKFLGTKSLGIFIRNMNAASQVCVSASSTENRNSVHGVGPMVSSPSINAAPPFVSRTRLQDIWLQRTTAQANTAPSTTGVSPVGKFNAFFETRNWDAQVLSDQASHQLPSSEFSTNSTTVDGSSTSPSKHLEISGDQFFQLLNDYYESVPATCGCGSDSGSAEGRASDGSQKPDGLERMARENSDLRNLIHQLEQAANRQTYANKMNHVMVPEGCRDVPVYHARHAAYHENLVRNPEDPPMFPAPKENEESPIVPLSIAHLFQDLMQIITANEVLIKSFQKEFKCFVAAQSPTARDTSAQTNIAVADHLLARMVQLKKENEEMGKLIGCGMRGNMLEVVRDEELNVMRRVIQDLHEQIKNTRVDTVVDLVPGEFMEMNNENQKLREEIGRLKKQNARLEERQEEAHADLREKIDSLGARNLELQEQLGDVWANIAESGL